MRCVIASFNQTTALATQWNREVGVTTPHLISPAPGATGNAGPLYADYRFLRSVAGVWAPASLRFYASQQLGGRELHSSQGQDVHMLAGDVVVGPDGAVALPYYSRTNTDRPGVDDLLTLARDLQRRHGTAPLDARVEARLQGEGEAAARTDAGGRSRGMRAVLLAATAVAMASTALTRL